MIFRSPPFNPFDVIFGEDDFMIWSIEEDIAKEDKNDQYCLLVGKEFDKKTFLRLKISFNKKFAISHSLTGTQWVVRYEDRELVWKAKTPSYEQILEQAKLMKERNRSMDIENVAENASSSELKNRIFTQKSYGISRSVSAKKFLNLRLKNLNHKSEPQCSRVEKTKVKFLKSVPITTVEKSVKMRDFAENEEEDGEKFNMSSILHPKNLLLKMPKIKQSESFAIVKKRANNIIQLSSKILHRKPKSPKLQPKMESCFSVLSLNTQVPKVKSKRSFHSRMKSLGSNMSLLSIPVRNRSSSSSSGNSQNASFIPLGSQLSCSAKHPLSDSSSNDSRITTKNTSESFLLSVKNDPLSGSSSSLSKMLFNIYGSLPTRSLKRSDKSNLSNINSQTLRRRIGKDSLRLEKSDISGSSLNNSEFNNILSDGSLLSLEANSRLSNASSNNSQILSRRKITSPILRRSRISGSSFEKSLIEKLLSLDKRSSKTSIGKLNTNEDDIFSTEYSSFLRNDKNRKSNSSFISSKGRNHESDRLSDFLEAEISGSVSSLTSLVTRYSHSNHSSRKDLTHSPDSSSSSHSIKGATNDANTSTSNKAKNWILNHSYLAPELDKPSLNTSSVYKVNNRWSNFSYIAPELENHSLNTLLSGLDSKNRVSASPSTSITEKQDSSKSKKSYSNVSKDLSSTSKSIKETKSRENTSKVYEANKRWANFPYIAPELQNPIVSFSPVQKSNNRWSNFSYIAPELEDISSNTPLRATEKKSSSKSSELECEENHNFSSPLKNIKESKCVSDSPKVYAANQRWSNFSYIAPELQHCFLTSQPTSKIKNTSSNVTNTPHKNNPSTSSNISKNENRWSNFTYMASELEENITSNPLNDLKSKYSESDSSLTSLIEKFCPSTSSKPDLTTSSNLSFPSDQSEPIYENVVPSFLKGSNKETCSSLFTSQSKDSGIISDKVSSRSQVSGLYSSLLVSDKPPDEPKRSTSVSKSVSMRDPRPARLRKEENQQHIKHARKSVHLTHLDNYHAKAGEKSTSKRS